MLLSGIYKIVKNSHLKHAGMTLDILRKFNSDLSGLGETE